MALGIPGYYEGNIQGKLIGLKMDGEFFKCETACTFSYEVEMLPCASVMSGQYQEAIPGKISWIMTVAGNLSLAPAQFNDFISITRKVQAKERVFLEMVTRNGISPYLSISGWAWPQNGGLDAQSTGLATWSNSFRGDGPFTTDWEEFAIIINAMPVAADKPYIVDTTEWG